jgi:hypothetical protein
MKRTLMTGITGTEKPELKRSSSQEDDSSAFSMVLREIVLGYPSRFAMLRITVFAPP